MAALESIVTCPEFVTLLRSVSPQLLIPLRFRCSVEVNGDVFFSASEQEVEDEYSTLAGKRGLTLQLGQGLLNPLSVLGAILPPGALHRLQEWNELRLDLGWHVIQ